MKTGRYKAPVGHFTNHKENVMTRKHTMIAMAFLALAAAAGFAQPSQPDRVTVPLTNPAKPAFIEVQVPMGSIKVTGYEGKEVIVEATVREKALTGGREGVGPVPPVPPMPPVPTPAPIHERTQREIERQLERQSARTVGEAEAQDKEEQAKKAGLKQIPLASSGLTVEEDDNHVTVEIESFRRAYDLVIKVPAGSSLNLETTNMGEIRVENVTGEVEVENMNGPITLQNVSGTVVASTTNGDIEAVLARVAPDKPMSFATFNGDVDVTLPPDAKASLRLKSQEGDVYSDFDLALKTAPVKTEESGKSTGRFRVSIERAALGAINGGGVEMKLETYNGNIYIRKKK
ncbi:MAG: hypothetical protein A2W03_07380 [Candidatus Aminicenantes bacterium RBG_16_63_16]|nr:MAG: hypothetical protein A2W03_07380 [Candidatus Aminicenantes bacterium RBG_16_63_16]